MVERNWQLKKLLGYLGIILGLGGILYVIWMYTIWPRTLPKFPTESSTLVQIKHQNQTRGGFGLLLAQPANQSQTPTPQPAKSKVLPINKKNTDAVNTTNTSATNQTESTTISIPRLEIKDARVKLNVNGNDESIYDTVLTQALAHLRYSAYPGEYGNTFIFGHSKLPLLASNDYESIFTNLPQVKQGDVVKIKYNGFEYTYVIEQTGVVQPDDVFVMNQPSTKRLLTLMTCIPPGFDNQRYITVGELAKVTRL